MGDSPEKRLAAAEAKIDVLSVALYGVLVNFVTRSKEPETLFAMINDLLRQRAERQRSPEIEAATNEMLAELRRLLAMNKRPKH